ncbi:MAG: helix-turn-helix transcriptional regulator [Ignavibacteria bacterium]|nr:helix-turn-helix transcriptional regulator [Ignavibacteria bacterium]
MNEKNWQVLVLLLKEIAKQKGITQQQIADKTGLLQSGIARTFSLRSCPKLDYFLQLADAIGVNFFFEDKEGKTDLNVAFEKAMNELGRRKPRGREN